MAINFCQARETRTEYEGFVQSFKQELFMPNFVYFYLLSRRLVNHYKFLF